MAFTSKIYVSILGINEMVLKFFSKKPLQAIVRARTTNLPTPPTIYTHAGARPRNNPGNLT